MKRRLAILGTLGFVAIAAAWWMFSWPSVSVRDVRQAETLVLGTETGEPAYAFSISGYGWIDGEATVTLLMAGQAYRVEQIRGKVRFEWGGDWYSETAEIRYEPINVRSGNLRFRCRIYKM